MIYEYVEEDSEAIQLQLEEIEEETEDSRTIREILVEILQDGLEAADKRDGGKTREKLKFDGVELPSRRKPAVPKPKDIAKPAKVTAKAPAKPGPMPDKPKPKPLPAVPNPVKTPAKPEAKPSSYNKAPIEDGVNVEGMIDNLLDTSISLPLRALLAASSPCRLRMRELCTGKRRYEAVAALQDIIQDANDQTMLCMEGHHQYSLDDLQGLNRGTDGQITASEAEKLKCFYPLVGGKRHYEALVDGGSSIVAVRKDVWLDLGIPLDHGRIMTMENASNGRNDSLGTISNLEIRVGEVRIHVQAIVMERGPYEILIGRPFFRLAKSLIKDDLNGAQTLTLTDVNSGASITIPTQDRLAPGKRRKVAHESLPEGCF